MKIYDISQEVFSCKVYPGDPAPEKVTVCSMDNGALYNLTKFSMCAHNGTHIDAPSHFIKNGGNVDDLPLEKTVGKCYVAEVFEDIDKEGAQSIILRARSTDPESAKRIIIKGGGVVTAEAAKVFAENGVDLVGVESQSVGPVEAPMEVHLILLGAKTVLLEGLTLQDVEEGEYFLFAAPINLGGCEGAPVRAILMGDF